MTVRKHCDTHTYILCISTWRSNIDYFHYRFNSKEYDSTAIERTENVIGEIYRHILYDEVVPDLNKRPSLFDMSWWHNKKCKLLNSLSGTFNCSQNAERFIQLNQTFHFQQN